MKANFAKVFAPASLSNLGPGYDVLGMAIDRPGDIAFARKLRERKLHFHLGSHETAVPMDAKKNVAAHVANLILQEFRWPFGIDLTLLKNMPIGSGLGSSAASSVAAAVAVNALLARPLKKFDLLRFVVEGERLASGSPHADNVAPSLLGGVCLIRSYHPLDVIQISVKNSIWFVVVHPHVVVMTKTARKILPKRILLTKAVNQWGNVSGLTAALMIGNVELFGRCMEDVVVEPVRAKLIPGFDEAKRAALVAGAFGCTITGSGPSMFAVAESREKAARIGRAMMRSFINISKIKSEMFVSKINLHGAKILEYSRG